MPCCHGTWLNLGQQRSQLSPHVLPSHWHCSFYTADTQHHTEQSAFNPCHKYRHCPLYQLVSAKLHYTDTGYGHVVQHYQRTSSQQFYDLLYNKFATSQCRSPTSRHVKMLGWMWQSFVRWWWICLCSGVWHLVDVQTELTGISYFVMKKKAGCISASLTSLLSPNPARGSERDVSSHNGPRWSPTDRYIKSF